ncbi:MAG: N-acetylmuramoyl-L-alanine amidase [Bacteroidota bacterium]|nr:N-acetylmuramoyl-L-alanine amidase [Bacteroidota bacterium]
MAACVALVTACAAFAPAPPVLTLVLDAGHGGKDPGNLGTGRYTTTEKDITLDVTLQLGAYIEENLPEVKVIYTRKDDSFPALRERVRIANEAQADLFVSIHCDAFDNAGARGSSTYVMGMHKSEESLRVAMRENASMFKEEGYERNYDGFDPNDPDTYIALSLRQNVNLDASLTLGAAIQQQFKERVGRRDRGVKQAGFYVISYTTMPSTLVELGFLTNPEEEDFLQSENGKAYMASAIYRAFRDTYLASRSDLEQVAPKTTEGQAAEAAEAANSQDAPAEDNAPTLGSEVWFGVQILTAESALPPDSPDLRGHSEAKPYIRHGLYKYVTGHHAHPDQAHEAKKALRAEGFDGAFVVAFDGETQIPMSRARTMLNLPMQ